MGTYIFKKIERLIGKTQEKAPALLRRSGRPGPHFECGLRRGDSAIYIAGVRVGHTTIIKGQGPLVEGKGPARTGVTAILAHGNNLARELSDNG